MKHIDLFGIKEDEENEQKKGSRFEHGGALGNNDQHQETSTTIIPQNENTDISFLNNDTSQDILLDSFIPPKYPFMDINRSLKGGGGESRKSGLDNFKIDPTSPNFNQLPSVIDNLNGQNTAKFSVRSEKN